ncbi:hypothetical protein FIBSPDRAFT_223475 [Athelia psychrophila]|uniref:Uncharacterized protein n=1 Tax=Athelia psychrophila TaxID=1759441 RepID=A0A166S4M6_9AGAM|nr:hypothetical protein FIBSPDRAFT_223475 [Fibularhizoctonia sp. CBS 109695]
MRLPRVLEPCLPVPLVMWLCAYRLPVTTKTKTQTQASLLRPRACLKDIIVLALPAAELSKPEHSSNAANKYGLSPDTDSDPSREPEIESPWRPTVVMCLPITTKTKTKTQASLLRPRACLKDIIMPVSCCRAVHT